MLIDNCYPEIKGLPNLEIKVLYCTQDEVKCKNKGKYPIVINVIVNGYLYEIERYLCAKEGMLGDLVEKNYELYKPKELI